MRSENMTKSLLLLAFCASAFAAPPTYKVINKIKIGGPASWDYVYVDSANHRLYVSHATQTEVIDTNTDKVVGTIPGTNGVHGIAVAGDLGRGFTSDGKDNDVTIFDLKTLAVIGKVKTGTNPDAIIYEPVTHRVFTFNGRSSDSTAFDAKTGAIVAASIPVGGKPEFSQVDGKGNVYFNNEDKNEIGVIDAKTATLTKHYSIAPCDGPSGLAIDPKEMHLFSVCGKKIMTISDPASGKLVGTADIGLGVDGVAFDDGYAFSANGRDGTITMVAETSPGKFAAVATITTTNGARTIGSDQKTHKLYLPAAEYGPATDSKDGKAARPQPLPDSFMIVVVGR
jgi:DNA-binding beta-propeller fold protein YncE